MAHSCVREDHSSRVVDPAAGPRERERAATPVDPAGRAVHVLRRSCHRLTGHPWLVPLAALLPLVVGLLVAAPVANAGTTAYTVTRLPTPPGAISRALGLNNRGEVVGVVIRRVAQTVRWRAGELLELGTLGGAVKGRKRARPAYVQWEAATKCCSPQLW